MFFAGMGLVVLATVFVGFARTYYLAGVFHAPLPNLLIHVHGALFSTWIVLLIVQTSLVAAGRVDVHRRLGLAGFGVACLMVLLGVLAASDALARGIAPGGHGATAARAFYAVPLTDILAFGTLIYFAFRERSHPAAHKRLVLIATIALLDAAFARWPVHAAWWNLRAAELCSYLLLLAIMGYDLWSREKIQPTTLWGSTLIIVLHLVRMPLGHTALWQSFAGWVQGIAMWLRA